MAIAGAKQQQLTFDKGITNVPSDAISSDNALEESLGMVYDDGEHRVIQKPVDYITSAVDSQTTPQAIDTPTIIYAHKFLEEERYIGYKSNNNIIYGIKDGLVFKQMGSALANTYTQDTKITSIGKTLIISDANGLHYYLWKPEGYKDLGTKIPEPKIIFSLRGEDGYISPNDYPLWTETDWSASDASYGFVSTTSETAGIIADREQVSAAINDHEEYNNLIAGMYAKNKKSIARRKGFCNPFFARWALELFDGSYTYVSQPFLLMPSVTKNSFCYYDFNYERITMFTYFKHLSYQIVTDYDYVNGQIVRLMDFSDIVKNIVVFISEGIDVYDTTGDQQLKQYDTSDEETTTIYDGIFYKALATQRTETYRPVTFSQINILGTSPWTFAGPNQKKKDEIISGLESESVFYKIAELGLKQGLLSLIDSKIETHTLENLTTQETLPEDDYFSRCGLVPSFIYAYNSRLNLANVSRGFFEGYGLFLAYGRDKSDPHDTYRYTFFVCIETDEGDKWLMHQEDTYLKQGCYFYYPDSRAKRVVIYKTETQNDPPTFGVCILNKELKEHSGLNGAYYLAGLPGIDFTDDPTSATDVDPSPTTLYNNSAKEILPNYIITSEVNNPWVFKAEGYNKVGTGKIIAMSTVTQALSQGQFGQYPLLVFSESGIWAMSVNNTGLFQAIHPMSREVCNNPWSITQTDGAVFFTSEKGLMVVVGSDVKCVSEQLSGLEADFTGEVRMGNFRDYLKDCFIAYDYRDSLLWIFNNSRTHVVSGQTVPWNTDYCYIYSIKSGTFGKYRFANAIENVVNNYPDYLLQTGSTLFSLTGRQNVNLDNMNYSGLMISRPMKWENGLALKSLMHIRNLRQFSSGATLELTLYGSNDCEHWYAFKSLRGTPWKYWRFRFDFSNMKATDRFVGTLVVTQERRTDKLR